MTSAMIDFVASFNLFMNDKMEEDEVEVGTSAEAGRDLHNRAEPNYKRKPLKYIFNDLPKSKQKNKPISRKKK